jgi:autonomous glycyl radical cofactor GrcA
MKSLLYVLFTWSAATAHAQHGDSGQHTRDIKALSAEEIEQYRTGAGMGHAKAAELNHFPGPMHVLELANELRLSDEQRAATRRLMDEHKREARAIGAKLIEAERAIEALFRNGKVEQNALARAVREAAAVEGEYRLSHLETHRRTRLLLTDEQVKRYDELRGYSSGQPAQNRHRH